MGFLGIFEPKGEDLVPGTVLLSDEAAPTDSHLLSLKHGKGRNKHIILTPQPSDDPNDPLNFSPFQKNLMVAITGLGTEIYAATVGPLLSAGVVEVSAELNISINALILTNGYQLLTVACTAPIASAIARKWGKRPVFLVSGLMCLIGSAIGSAAHSYNLFLASRIVQGFSTCAYESLFISMIGDLFFVHQCGVYVSLANIFLAAGSSFSNVICGRITAALGWKYLFHFLILTGGFHLILQYLFVPETQFTRQHSPLRSNAIDLLSGPNAKLTEESKAVEVEDASTFSPTPARKTFWQRLAIFTGSYSDDHLAFLIFTPVTCCLNLAVLWSVLVSGYFFSFYVGILYVLAQVFSAPPYELSPDAVGYLCLAPFVGGLLAGGCAALINDPIVKWCTNKNKGIYEPEYRIILGIGSWLTVAGVTAFGYTAQRGDSFYLTAFLHGLATFGLVWTMISTTGYVLDAFRDMGNEIFLASMACKNFIAFGYSYFFNDWVATKGIFEVMWVLAAVGAGLWITFPIMFIFGKVYRGYWNRNNLVLKLGVTTHQEF